MATSLVGLISLLFCSVLVFYVTGKTPCDTTSDCGDGECCLSNLDLVGKRQAHVAAAGTCTPLSSSDDKCHVNDKYDPLRIYYSVCPCEHDLRCQSLHVNEVPFGPIGNCSSN